MKNSNVFDKNCTQENVKCHIQYEKGNIIFRLYLKAFLEEVIVMHTQKMRAKYMKEDVWKSFFVNFHVGISQLHYRLASKQYIFRDFK